MKTILDLYNSADKAAQAAAVNTTAFADEQSALASFTADGNDPADWAPWKQFYFQRLPSIRALANNLKIWSSQPAPSAQAAAKVTAAAPALKVVPAATPAAPAAPAAVAKAT